MKQMTDREPAESIALSIEEAAKLLGISRSHAYTAARNGELPTIKIGGRILVPRAALMRLLEQPLPSKMAR